MSVNEAMEQAELQFRLPDLGEGLVSAEIVEWLVKVGDRVEVDQAVVVVETEKTATELPIPFAGTVARLYGEPGERLPVGAVLVTVLGEAGADRAASSVTHLVGQGPALEPGPAENRLAALKRLPPKGGRERVAASPAVRRLARELDVELGSVTGTGPGGAITREDVEAAAKSRTASERTGFAEAAGEAAGV